MALNHNTSPGRFGLTDLMIIKYARQPEAVLKLIKYEGKSRFYTIVGATTVPAVLRMPMSKFAEDRATVLAASDADYAPGSLKVIVTEAAIRGQDMEQVRYLGRAFPPDSCAHLRIIPEGSVPAGLTDFTLFTEPPAGELPAVFLAERGELCRDTSPEALEHYSALAGVALGATLSCGDSYELIGGIFHEKRLAANPAPQLGAV